MCKDTVEKKFEVCNECKYRIIEKLQFELMLGIEISKLLYMANCEKEEYEDIKYHLASYVESIKNASLKDNINVCCINCINCNNCNSKLRVEKSRKYFKEMLNVMNSNQHNYMYKLNKFFL